MQNFLRTPLVREFYRKADSRTRTSRLPTTIAGTVNTGSEIFFCFLAYYAQESL